MNNRAIKFRTWDNQKKEFAEWTNRDPFFSTSEGRIFFWDRTRNEDGSYGGDIVVRDLSDRFTLQQFTGLCDSNGKDIYEGDILKEKMTEEMAANGGDCSLDVVRFNGGAFLIDGVPACNYVAFDTPNMLEDFEVVGNILEDPELLK